RAPAEPGLDLHHRQRRSAAGGDQGRSLIDLCACGPARRRTSRALNRARQSPPSLPHSPLGSGARMTADGTFRPELVHESVYIAAGAAVVGDVTIAADASVWYQAVLRGDCSPSRIGRRSNVQDCAVLHADPGFPCTLGEGVTVGHGAVVHGATVGDNVVIGMK